MLRRVLLGLAVSALSVAAAAQDSSPDWVRKPSGDDLMAAWPVRALERGLGGKAMLLCEVNVRGGLENCSVESESPAGEGFGAAALLLTPSFQMKPKVRDGQPERGVVRIPISFADPGGGVLWAPSVTMIARPLWKSAPSFDDMAAAWPKGAAGLKDGKATLRCKIDKANRLDDCQTLADFPRGKGFAAAAKKLAPMFELAVDPRAGGEKKAIYVNLTFAFVAPDALGARTVSYPRWIQGPDSRQVLAIFPDAALQKGYKEGLGVADCAVAPDGSLTDCRAAREEPAGLGFGEAAVRIAQVMRMSPWTEDGRPVDGARIKLPIRFKWTPD